MSYKDLLLRLKNKVANKAKLNMDVSHGALNLSCCVYTSPRGHIPLNIQHYLENKKILNIPSEPSLHVFQNKIYLTQKIPLEKVNSFRSAHASFLNEAEKYKNILHKLSVENIDFSFA